MTYYHGGRRDQMNVNQLTKSYIKDIFRIIKKYHLFEIRVNIIGYDIIFIEGDDYRIIVLSGDDGMLQKVFMNKDLKLLLDEFENSSYYMAKIKKEEK